MRFLMDSLASQMKRPHSSLVDRSGTYYVSQKLYGEKSPIRLNSALMQMEHLRQRLQPL